MNPKMLADSLFPSCCPVWETLCAYFDDTALVNITKTHKKRAVVSAMREMGTRPVFVLLKRLVVEGLCENAALFRDAVYGWIKMGC